MDCSSRVSRWVGGCSVCSKLLVMISVRSRSNGLTAYATLMSLMEEFITLEM
jgi:hypothetical protein